MRRFCVILGAAASAALIGVASPADELRIGYAVEPVSIDPHFSLHGPTRQISRSIFDKLVEQDAKGQPVPNLALTWKVIDDNTWELPLRKGVKWHDGSPFTADDVAFTFDRVVTVKTGGTGGFGAYIAGKKVVVVDDHTIRVRTEKPNPLVARELATIEIASKKHSQGATTEDFNSGKVAVGTGPFKFVEWISGDRLVLEVSPVFWGEKPDWDRVVYKPIKSPPSRIAALLSGEVDLISEVPTESIKRLENDPNFVLHHEASSRLMFLWPDAVRDLSPFVTTAEGKPYWPNPLRDWRVRKALSKAIDRKAIVTQIMESLAKPAGQLVDEGVFGYNPALKVEPFDPEGAKKLLVEAGYGDTIHLTIHCAVDRDKNADKVSQTVAGMWTRVGVKTAVSCMPEAAQSSMASKREVSMMVRGWTMDTGEASSPLKLALHTRTESFGIFNHMRYANDRLDTKIMEALVTMSEPQREKVLQEATAIAINDLAWIPLQYQFNSWASRKGIRYEARADAQTLAQSAFKVK